MYTKILQKQDGKVNLKVWNETSVHSKIVSKQYIPLVTTHCQKKYVQLRKLKVVIIL